MQGQQDIEYTNITSLTDAGVGFLITRAILQQEISQKKGMLREFRLRGVENTCILQAVEMFLKVFLLKEGKRLDKLQTHKVYDLFKKLKPETQQEFVRLVHGDGCQHLASLEPVLQDNNEKMIRLRYNDLNKSASLTFSNGDVLLHFAQIMCNKLGEKIMIDDQEWSWRN